MKEERRKEKGSRNKQNEQDNLDDERDEVISKYIDELPDPNKYYGSDDENDDENDDERSDNESGDINSEDNNSDDSQDNDDEIDDYEKGKGSKRKYDSDENSQSDEDNLSDDEAFALHLLNQWIKSNCEKNDLDDEQTYKYKNWHHIYQ